MGAILLFTLLVIGVIVYYRIKNNYQKKHPKKCDFCEKEFAEVTKLIDGCICSECQKVAYGDKQIDLYSCLLNVKKRKVTVSEVGEFKKSLTERGEIARSFHATRVSPSGAIVVDDNLGLFIAGDDPMPQYARRTADIEKFKLVIERNLEDSTTDSLYVNGGHIEITLNELFDKLIVSVPVEQKIIGMKHHIKKTYEDDIRFLEKVTGKKRS